MNVSLQNNDKVSIELTIKIEKADYQDQVTQSLKKFRQKANVPGFRQGMVPVGMVKKMYGKSIEAEEVNKLVSDALFGYIKEHNIKMLGEPMPSEINQPDIDFDTMEDFEFVFDIALSPEITIDLSANDKVDYISIEVSQEMMDQQISQYTQRTGKYEKVEVFEKKDMLKGLIQELDEKGNTKEGGIMVEGAVMMPDYMQDETQKYQFIACKVGDIIVFNPQKAFGANEAEISSLLKIQREEVAAVTADFSIQIEEITRHIPGALDQELFDQIYGEGAVSTAEEFLAKTKEALAERFEADSDYKFLLDVRALLTNKIGKLTYADSILKRVMLQNESNRDMAAIEANYEKSMEELSWHLIKEQLIKELEVKIDDTDLTEIAKQAAKAQFAQYGMLSVPDDVMENYAQSMLKDKKNIQNLVDRALEAKLAVLLKEKVTLTPKTVSMDEFNKLFEELA